MPADPRAPIPFPCAAGRPLVLGHRGASARAPENTLAAFACAMEEGADGFELDVWRCGSGEVVVIHDEDARRVSGEPLAIAHEPVARLRALDVGVWRGREFAGERVPLLEEVLERFPAAVVNVELKAARLPDLRLATAVARIVRQVRATHRVVVSSFSCALLGAFRLAAPEVPAGYLVDRRRAWALRAAACTRVLGIRALHPARELVTEARAEAWRTRGLALAVWTVDDAADAVRLGGLGVAAIITNDPRAVREALSRAGRAGQLTR
ncbi:MAG TPA: glycerophosphodiester phosphodiesterase family protein [Anaeromyxobacteraceae bacterium]|nr:glycerophosphodiester phosphodiesterase family protein [Anaeromyxobacteraceae bacterium]